MVQVLLVEDDHLQADALQTVLEKAFLRIKVRRIATESEFRAWLEAAEAPLPDVIVIDMMLRWADPAPEIPTPPDEVKSNGRYRAGERCRNLLRDHQETAGIPVILHTVLERSDVFDLPEEAVLVTKDSNPGELIEHIRRATMH